MIAAAALLLLIGAAVYVAVRHYPKPDSGAINRPGNLVPFDPGMWSTTGVRRGKRRRRRAAAVREPHRHHRDHVRPKGHCPLGTPGCIYADCSGEAGHSCYGPHAPAHVDMLGGPRDRLER